MFHYPTTEVEDRIYQPEQKYWEAGEREAAIEERKQEIEHQVKRMFNNWGSDGKTIKVVGVEWTPNDIVESIWREGEDTFYKAFRGCKETYEKLISDWSHEMAEKEVETGVCRGPD